MEPRRSRKPKPKPLLLFFLIVALLLLLALRPASAVPTSSKLSVFHEVADGSELAFLPVIIVAEPLIIWVVFACIGSMKFRSLQHPPSMKLSSLQVVPFIRLFCFVYCISVDLISAAVA
jgi:hypothetical protein